MLSSYIGSGGYGFLAAYVGRTV